MHWLDVFRLCRWRGLNVLAESRRFAWAIIVEAPLRRRRRIGGHQLVTRRGIDLISGAEAIVPFVVLGRRRLSCEIALRHRLRIALAAASATPPASAATPAAFALLSGGMLLHPK